MSLVDVHDWLRETGQNHSIKLVDVWRYFEKYSPEAKNRAERIALLQKKYNVSGEWVTLSNGATVSLEQYDKLMSPKEDV